MGQLNIKDSALIEKVRLLAEQRQTSQTEVLRQVVNEALDRDARARAADRAARMAAIDAIVARTARRFDASWDGRHDYLYDEHGLPK